MADSAAASKSPAKKTKSVKKPAKAAAHPPYANMISAAIAALKERNGSSRQAILKYIVATFKVGDEKKAASRLRLALVKSVSSGALKQVKGTGASGSFRLAKDDKPVTPGKRGRKPGVKKATSPKKKTTVVAKKAGTPKKKAAAKKPVAKKAGTPKKKVVKKVTKKPAVKKTKKSPKKAAAKK